MKSEIKFLSGGAEGIEVLILSKKGVWANPDVPVDETAKYVLDALDVYIRNMVDKAVADEREACAEACEDIPLPQDPTALTHLPTIERCAAAIRARGDK